jgi:hypothetical protein
LGIKNAAQTSNPMRAACPLAGKAAASLVRFRCFVLFLALKEPIAREWRL